MQSRVSHSHLQFLGANSHDSDLGSERAKAKATWVRRVKAGLKVVAVEGGR